MFSIIRNQENPNKSQNVIAHSPEWLTWKRMAPPIASKGMVQPEFSYWEWNCPTALDKVWQCLIKLNIHAPHGPNFYFQVFTHQRDRQETAALSKRTKHWRSVGAVIRMSKQMLAYSYNAMLFSRRGCTHTAAAWFLEYYEEWKTSHTRLQAVQFHLCEGPEPAKQTESEKSQLW